MGIAGLTFVNVSGVQSGFVYAVFTAFRLRITAGTSAMSGACIYSWLATINPNQLTQYFDSEVITQPPVINLPKPSLSVGVIIFTRRMTPKLRESRLRNCDLASGTANIRSAGWPMTIYLH